MTSMVQTDLGPSAVAKYKDDPIDSPVSSLITFLLFNVCFGNQNTTKGVATLVVVTGWSRVTFDMIP